MPKIESQTRTHISALLLTAIANAIGSYQLFSQEHATKPKNEAESKAFKAHHDACRIGIAHLELLIKLAQWADTPEPCVSDENEQKALQTMIENAQSELKGLRL